MKEFVDREYMTNLLVDMVRIDSVNPDLVPGAAGECELAKYIFQVMQEIGLEADLIEIAPNRPNVIGRLKGTGSGPSLMLNAHTDTVGVEGMDDPFSGEIRDGRCYGRGAYDMKASIAAALAAAKALVDANIA